SRYGGGGCRSAGSVLTAVPPTRGHSHGGARGTRTARGRGKKPQGPHPPYRASSGAGKHPPPHAVFFLSLRLHGRYVRNRPHPNGCGLRYFFHALRSVRALVPRYSVCRRAGVFHLACVRLFHGGAMAADADRPMDSPAEGNPIRLTNE